MKIVYKNTADLIPYENNPRDNAGSIAVVKKSIADFGFKVPIIVDADNVIIAGHTRLMAAQQLNITEVPCIVADDLTPEQVRAFRLADNKSAEMSEWLPSELAKELEELMSSGIDMSAFGFDTDEFDIDYDGLTDSFSLPDGDKANVEQMTFTFSSEQAELVRRALSMIDETPETFGNENKNGNKLYEVVRQWLEQKSL